MATKRQPSERSAKTSRVLDVGILFSTHLQMLVAQRIRLTGMLVMLRRGLTKSEHNQAIADIRETLQRLQNHEQDIEKVRRVAQRLDRQDRLQFQVRKSRRRLSLDDVSAQLLADWNPPTKPAN